MVLPALPAVAGLAAGTAARSTVTDVVRGVIGGIARAFGFGAGAAAATQGGDSQSSQTTTQDQDSSGVVVSSATRGSVYGKPADTVDRLSALSGAMQNNNKAGEDVGERLSGSGNIAAILSSIDKNIQFIANSISSMGRGVGGSSREAEIGRRSSFSPEAMTDMKGFLTALGLMGVSQIIPNIPSGNNPAAADGAVVPGAADPASLGLTEPGYTPVRPQQTQQQSSVISEEELSRITDLLAEPEQQETESNREARDRLVNQLVAEIDSQPRGPTYRVPAEVMEYVRQRRERESRSSSEAPNTPSIESAPEEPLSNPSITNASANYEAPQPRTERLIEPIPRQRNQAPTETQPSMLTRAWTGAWDVISGRNIARLRANNAPRSLSSAIDDNYNTGMGEAIQATPMQAPTIINNNNIIQGGGGGEPAVAGATGTPSMPAGSATPVIIGVSPTPPSSPAFFNYAN